MYIYQDKKNIFLSERAVYNDRQRLGVISLKEGLNHIGWTIYTPNLVRRIICGTKISFSGIRMRTFYHKGTNCISCKNKGSYFAIERHDSYTDYHVNLYGLTSGGSILMTVDHIVPKAFDGKSTLENLQPMCSNCNNLKGTTSQEDFLFGRKLGISLRTGGIKTIKRRNRRIRQKTKKARLMPILYQPQHGVM